MGRKQYSIYKLTSPSGRAYVGFTSQPVSGRWRQHVGRADRGGKHPLCSAIRKYGKGAFCVETLATYDVLDDALKAEVAAIAGLENAYNISPGGDFDGGAGVARFRELMTDPVWRATYLERLSTSMKTSVRYAESRKRIAGVLDAWRLENPAKAYRTSMRNLRIGVNRRGRKKPPVEPGRLPRQKGGAAAKLHRSRVSREKAQRQWAEMEPAKKAAVHAKIATSIKRVHAEKGPEEKAAHAAQLAEARKSIDHDYRKAQQKLGLKAYWTEERRAEFGRKVKARNAARKAQM